jgi:hypothetical protein
VKDAGQRVAMRQNIMRPEIRERARVLHRLILARREVCAIRKNLPLSRLCEAGQRQILLSS